MNQALSALLTIGFLLFAGLQVSPAQAQLLGFDSRSGFGIFVDQRGRRYLVDPDTGEVIGRANRNARFTRRDKIRAQRALRRSLRRERIRREFARRFDDDFDAFDDRSRRRFSNNDRGFFLDEGPRRRSRQELRRQRELRRRNDPFQDRRLGEPQKEQTIERKQLARLPERSQPVERPTPLAGIPKPKFSQEKMAELQIFLDRSGFSPGVVDGKWGTNVANAMATWKKATGSKVDLGNARSLDQLLQKTGGAVFQRYTITSKDVAGPFATRIPVDYGRKAQLTELSYTSVEEMLAERFHMSLAYLRQLNPGKNFRAAGTSIRVAAPGNPVRRAVHYIIADKGRKQVRALDRNGNLVASYPATIGSSSTPSPSGKHTVARIALNPEYTYNPKINFKQGNNNKILRIAPGPNGPVGSVWIALSKPTYGIHGTPNPSTIGKTNSHGCIRLTNWDAQELAKLVRKGVTVEFLE